MPKQADDNKGLARKKPHLRLSCLSPVLGNVYRKRAGWEEYVGYFWRGRFWPLYTGVLDEGTGRR